MHASNTFFHTCVDIIKCYLVLSRQIGLELEQPPEQLLDQFSASLSDLMLQTCNISEAFIDYRTWLKEAHVGTRVSPEDVTKGLLQIQADELHHLNT